MNLKKGDNVIVRVGKDRGKTGSIARVDRVRQRVTVNNVNLYKKHVRPKRQGEKGEVVQLARPIRIDNVALMCPNCAKGVRVGFRMDGDRKVRFCKKCKVPL